MSTNPPWCLLWSVVLASCHLPDPAPVNRPGICMEVCDRQRENGCPGHEGYDDPDGNRVPCENACVEQFAADPTMEELLLCEAKAKTCTECEGGK